MNDIASSSQIPGRPWWKFGHVWLILAGPALVVVAGFVTLYLAISRPDPVVSPEDYRQGLELSRSVPGDASSLAPAVQARNHAQTGVPAATSAPVTAKP